MAEKATLKVIKNYVALPKKNKLDIKNVYLFGSYAKGVYNVNSDIDVAIVFDNLGDTFDMQVKLMKLRRKFDNRIEPHVFRQSDFELSNPLAKEILTTGVEIL